MPVFHPHLPRVAEVSSVPSKLGSGVTGPRDLKSKSLPTYSVNRRPTKCVLIDTGPGILSLTRFVVTWAGLATASKYPDTVATRGVADTEVYQLAVGVTEHALDSG